MSRRWYRHGGNMVFVGWDRSAQMFLLTVAEMCTRCGGFGEEPDTDNFCFACGGEGVRFGSNSVTQLGLTAGLDEVAQELSRLEIPFPAEVRTDLEQDRAINAGEILHDYGQASQPSNS